MKLYTTLLNVRTEYSFLDSLIKIDEYILFAKKNNIKCLAISDFNNMHGFINFYNKCIENKIKPIFSINSNFFINKKKFNFNIIPKNYFGYSKLCHISSLVMKKKVVNIEDIVSILKEDFFIILNLESFIIVNKLENYLQNLNIEIKNVFYGITQKTNLDFLKNIDNNKLIFNYKVSYLNFDDNKIYKCLKAIKNKKTLKEINILSIKNYINLNEIKIFKYEKFLKNIDYIINNSNVFLNKRNVNIFNYEIFIKENISSFDFLKKICIKKLNFLKKNRNIDFYIYEKRLNYELKVLKKMNFINYFLIVWDYVNFAKTNDIMVGPGRGSASSSLISYLLDITMIDPIKNKLLFERFLNSKRVNMPDIDIDFEDIKRNDVIKYLFLKYGKDHVAMISTFQTFGIKLVMRDLGKILNIEDSIINIICKNFSNETIIDIEYSIQNSDILKMYSERYKELFFYAKKIVGLPKQSGTHAAGIVISQNKLNEFIPVHTNSLKINQVQFSMEYLEYFGLIKMDLLGLHNLTIFHNILKKISKYEKNNINLLNIPLDDKKTFSLLTNGDTLGIFQLESPGMTNVLKKVEPKNLFDIAATISLYRPGPMKNIDLYIKNKKFPNNIKFLNNDIKKILIETYGIIIYQEQIMLITQKIANFSLENADILRYAMAKKNINLMNSLKKMFFINSRKNLYDEISINKIWNLIIKFANYGFNKSHALSYALLGYWLAYLKINYSKYFFIELLNNFSNSNNKINNNILEAKKFNIKFLKPSINRPLIKYKIIENYIAIPLIAIKQIGNFFVKNLSNELKKGIFINIFDFCNRMYKNGLNKIIFEALVYSGALDLFKYNRTTMIKNMETFFLFAKSDRIIMDKDFFNNEKSFTIISYKDDILKNFSMEKMYLGFYLSFNPIKKIIEKYNLKNVIIDFYDIISNSHTFINKNVDILCSINNLRKIFDKNKNEMAYLEVSDSNNYILDVVIFAKKYKIFSPFLKENKFFLINIKIGIRNKINNFILNNIKECVL